MADDKFPSKTKGTEGNPEVVFEVKNDAEGARLVSILQQVSMSRSAPTMLGFILTDEKLRKEFSERDPNFYNEAFARIKAEADARTKCIEQEPGIAEKAYRFANRGQFIALFVTLCGLAASVYLAYVGAHTGAGCVGVASLAPGLVSAYVNRNKEEAKQDDLKPAPPKGKWKK